MSNADIILGVMVIVLFALGFMVAVFLLWLILLGIVALIGKARTRHTGYDLT